MLCASLDLVSCALQTQTCRFHTRQSFNASVTQKQVSSGLHENLTHAQTSFMKVWPSFIATLLVGNFLVLIFKKKKKLLKNR